MIPVVADVSKREGAEALVRAAEASFGGLGILFNNAGIERLATVADTTEELCHEQRNTLLRFASSTSCQSSEVPGRL